MKEYNEMGHLDVITDDDLHRWANRSGPGDAATIRILAVALMELREDVAHVLARIAELEAENARLPVRDVRVKDGAIVGRLFGEGE